MNYFIDTDVCVIGAGHAGCEAALACARLGYRTVIFTMNVDSIAMMPCNPHIGGSSKGHLVREIDALGGEMGKNIDKTFIQSKMLNISKGPAVHSLRTQADKAEYSKAMRKILENQENLTIRQVEVTDILTQYDLERLQEKDGGKNQINEQTNEQISNQIFDQINKDDQMSNDGQVIDQENIHAEKLRVAGVRIHTGTIYTCKAAIICTGTYLNARCLVGESITETGPGGMQRSTWLKDSMDHLGIPLRRFKTGTPARMDGRTLDYSKMKIQPGDPVVVPFSYSTDPADVQIEQVPCWLTYTNDETHEIIRQNLDRSPIYAGIIEGTGPRYCPSIEDKVVKFSEKSRHHVFIEPEGRFTNEVYVDGMSSSMPDDVQQRMYRTVPGLENCVIVKNAYAIEYDCINANQLKLSLETKAVDGLFCAGQFNGSSGYEEAAAQGLIAGINAVNKIRGREPLVLERSEAYIGVLIDDLVTKDNREPYRMMTSRAEYRLLLRQDNADIRLREKGYQVGLISKEQMNELQAKKFLIDREVMRLKDTLLGANKEVQDFLESKGSSPLKTAASLAELICRPEFNYEAISAIDRNRDVSMREFIEEAEEYFCPVTEKLLNEVKEQVEIEIKYEGYISRQKRQVEQYQKMEVKRIPEDLDYDDVPSLRLEARQKLKEFRPVSVGQASRISGVSPADISVLLIYLEHQNQSRQGSN